MPAGHLEVEPLSEHDAAILAAFVAHGFDLAAAAASLGLTHLDLLAWYRRPAVRQALAELEALEDQAARLAHLAARRDAIAVLHDLTRNAPDPLERRRAATALIARPTPPRPWARCHPEGMTEWATEGPNGADLLPDLHRLDPRSLRPHTGSPARSDAAVHAAEYGTAGPAVSEAGGQPSNFAGVATELASSKPSQLIGDPVLHTDLASLLRTGCVSLASSDSG